MNMKRKHKFRPLLLGAITIAMGGGPVGLAYSINELKPSSKLNFDATPRGLHLVKPNQEKPLEAADIVNKLLEGEMRLLDLSTDDWMKIVQALKSPNVKGDLRALKDIYPTYVAKLKEVDDSVIRWFIDIILNKGLAKIKRTDLPKIKQILGFVFDKSKDPKAFEYAEYLVVAISEGITKLTLENNNAFFEKKAPQLVDKIIAKLQGTRELELGTIKSSIIALLRKVLIVGYENKIVNDKVLKTAQELFATDIVDIIYELSDSGLLGSKIPETKTFSVPVIGSITFSIRDILYEAVLSIANFMVEPTTAFLDKKVVPLEEKMKSVETEVSRKRIEVQELQSKKNEKELSRSLSADETIKLINEVTSFQQQQPFSYILMQLRLDGDAIADVDKYDDPANNKDYYNEPNDGLTAKWYENKEKAYWVLARSLWNLHPGDNKSYQTKEAWYAKVESDWKYGITYGGVWTFWYGWVNKGGLSSFPDSERLLETVKVAYSEKIANDFYRKWLLIKSEQARSMIAQSASQQFVKPPFTYKQMLLASKLIIINQEIDELARQITEAELAIENKVPEIEDLRNQITAIKTSSSYTYEKKLKVTRQDLLANEFFKGKGLLRLSQPDLSKVFYKLQDLILNHNYYLDLVLAEVLKKTTDKAIDDYVKGGSIFTKPLRLAAALAASLALDVFNEYITTKIKADYISPYITRLIKPDLVKKIKHIDPIRFSEVVHEVINNPIRTTPNSSFAHLFLVAKKFIDLKLSNKDLLNMLIAVKRGFRALPLSSRTSLVDVVLQKIIALDDKKRKLVMSFI